DQKKQRIPKKTAVDSRFSFCRSSAFHASNMSFKSRRGRQRFPWKKAFTFGSLFICSIQPKPFFSRAPRYVRPANRFSFSGTQGLSFFFAAYIAWTNSR